MTKKLPRSEILKLLSQIASELPDNDLIEIELYADYLKVKKSNMKQSLRETIREEIKSYLQEVSK